MKPYILITNDDGVYSSGLKALAEALNDLADIIIVGPIKQQTGMGRAFPYQSDNGIIERVNLEINHKPIMAYGVHGSPAYVVAHALLELVERKPDLCLCGINYGENLGLSITCSGTLGAAFEANSHGISAIAFSKAFDLDKQHDENLNILDWTNDKILIHKIITQILKLGFPPDVCLYNVNLPKEVNADTKIRMTRQSRSNYSEFDRVNKRDYTKPHHLTSTTTSDFMHLDKHTDIYTVAVDKLVSVTPIRWDISLDNKIEFK